MLRSVGSLLLAVSLLLVFSVAAYAFPMGAHVSGGGVQVEAHVEGVVLQTGDVNVHVDVPGATVKYNDNNGTVQIETPVGRVVVVSPRRVVEHIREHVLQRWCGDRNTSVCDALQNSLAEKLRLRKCTAYDPDTKGIRDKYCYEAPVKVRARFLGIFSVEFDEVIRCDAETGVSCEVSRPWWAFLAFGEEPVVEGNA